MALPVTLSNVVRCDNALRHTYGPFKSSGGNFYGVFLDSTNNYTVRILKATDPTSSWTTPSGGTKNSTSSQKIHAFSAWNNGDDIYVFTVLDDETIEFHVWSMSSDSWTTSNSTVTSATAATLDSAKRIYVRELRSDGDIIIEYGGAPDNF